MTPSTPLGSWNFKPLLDTKHHPSFFKDPPLKQHTLGRVLCNRFYLAPPPLCKTTNAWFTNHKPLPHDSPRASIYSQGKFAWTAQVDDLGCFAATGISGLSTHRSFPPSQIPNPTNAIGCPPLVFRGFKIQLPKNFTMRPIHVPGKQPRLRKEWFLDVWSYVGEKESKWTGLWFVTARSNILDTHNINRCNTLRHLYTTKDPPFQNNHGSSIILSSKNSNKQSFRGFTISEKQKVSNIHQHGVPSQHHHCFCRWQFFRQESYQWKDLKQLWSVWSMCMWFRSMTLSCL